MAARSFSLYFDPSIFFRSQSDGGFNAIADLYWDAGLNRLMSARETAEIAGMERILEHWRNLYEREPKATLEFFPQKDCAHSVG